MTPEIEAQLKAEIASLKELLVERDRRYEERFIASTQALRLQAAEYGRRLDALNGEAERLRQMQATYLPREIYETSQTEVIKKVDELRQGRNVTEGKSQGISAVWLVIVVLIGFAISIAALIQGAVK